jgi:hypothetical protein
MNGAAIVAVISGHISKLDTDQFEKDQEVTLVITATDGETLLKAPAAVSVDLEEVTPGSMTLDDQISTAPHGFTMQLVFTDDVSLFRFVDPDWTFELTPVGGFLEDDILAFSSELNDKYVYVIRGSEVIHLADVITAGSVWPIMFPGANPFVLLASDKFKFLDISYFPTYWGV